MRKFADVKTTKSWAFSIQRWDIKKDSWEASIGSRNLSKKIDRLLNTRSSLSSCLRRLPIIYGSEIYQVRRGNADPSIAKKLIFLTSGAKTKRVTHSGIAISRTPTISSRHSQDHLVHDSHQSSSSMIKNLKISISLRHKPHITSHWASEILISLPTHSRTSSVAKTKMDGNQKNKRIKKKRRTYDVKRERLE